MNANDIISTSKTNDKHKILRSVKQAALKYFNNQKEGHSKLNDIKYRSVASKHINNEEAQLLYTLRSRGHARKLNFRKLYRNV